MAVSVNTPILDQEILRIRRALGDLFSETGAELVLDTASSATYVGGSGFVATWTAAELLDIYNSACIRYIEYVTKMLDKKLWEKYIRGYVVRKSAATLTSGVVNLDALSPLLWMVIDTALASPTSLAHIGVEISPSEYYAHKSGAVKTRTGQLLFAFMNDGTNNTIQYLNYGAATTIDILYIKMHTNFIHDSSVTKDVTVFTPAGLERIRLIAVKMAQAYKSSDVRDLPQVEERTEIELDLSAERKP